ncbi:glycoside hydrolase domain-containing protein [Agriterribacter sp.]|uniref:glycoside hydrolase domain-containing protein n=1 Tax=Agriterribacter sp. TaxID=2821509 RepID=UPI002BD0022A|nr:glycoside hydrolase domain-containing protein [Agriterribacter sp.]HRO45901.1 DUF6067 family protein [Agriterribacter sp.]HRO97272.1 DUF6067 family protein [Ferruginibacter sp.]
MHIKLFYLLLFVPGIVLSQEGFLTTSSALQKYGDRLSNRSFMAFPEVRERPLIPIDGVPEKAIDNALSGIPYTLVANPGEYFVFQVGVWALHNTAPDIKVEFSSFASKGRKSIAPSQMTCFNTAGTDYTGRAFTKGIDVAEGKVQSLWIGVNLQGIDRGEYTGKVTVNSKGTRQVIPVVLKVEGDAIPNHGYDEGKRLSRLNWLNNYTLGVSEEVTKGYTPVEVKGNTVNILGRSLRVGKDGLPETIETYFGPSNQSLVQHGEPIVNKSFRFVVEKESGEKIYLKPGKLTINRRSASRAEWSVLSTSPELDVECKAQMEYDGFVDYRLKVKAKVPLQIKDIRLEVPVTAEKSKYMMGLGHDGGFRKPDWKWQWDVNKNQDILWLGAVNGGMRIKLKAENYILPHCDSYYGFRKLTLPPSWGNENKGGVVVNDAPEGDVLVNAFSGSRSMEKGQVLNYDFELLLTPFKVIDRDIKFNDRYFQDLPNCPELLDPGYNSTTADVKIGLAKKSNANYLIVHHDVDIYPFINYPSMDENTTDLKNFVAKANRENLGVRLYYTTRYLTVHQPEFWAFNSLNNEIILPGPGEKLLSKIKPHDPRNWFLKNMKGRQFLSGNYESMEEGRFTGVSDLSVVTPPGTRLDNFYIGYFDWMVRNLGVDGFFYDETSLNRITLRRARKILDSYRTNGRLDLHSYNHYNKGRGFANSVNFYMELLPYFDFTWIGEGQSYDSSPDRWLVELSGIPFGVPGQMLWEGGNPWRGMVYGITKREGWRPIELNPPTGMWKFWDEHSFSKKTMIGYWEKNNPVQCADSLIKTSVYTGGGEVILAIGNWSEQNREIALKIDWERLGLDKSKVKIEIPEIGDFQWARSSINLDQFFVPGGKGYIIILKP